MQQQERPRCTLSLANRGLFRAARSSPFSFSLFFVFVFDRVWFSFVIQPDEKSQNQSVSVARVWICTLLPSENITGKKMFLENLMEGAFRAFWCFYFSFSYNFHDLWAIPCVFVFSFVPVLFFILPFLYFLYYHFCILLYPPPPCMPFDVLRALSLSVSCVSCLALSRWISDLAGFELSLVIPDFCFPILFLFFYKKRWFIYGVPNVNCEPAAARIDGQQCLSYIVTPA